VSSPETRPQLLRVETFDPRPWAEWAEMHRRSGTAPPEHGPWETEPDFAGWTDEATGWPCMARRGPAGNWCGYCCVPKGSPFWGLSRDAPINTEGNSLEELVGVHGGLTFSDSLLAEGDWWFGFDCNHAWDINPGMPHFGVGGSEYRTLDYTIEQTAGMALQLLMLTKALI
jgi:hypothetical protein